MTTTRATPLQLTLLATLLVLLALGALSTREANQLNDRVWRLHLSADARFLVVISDRGATIYEPASRRVIARVPGAKQAAIAPDDSLAALSTFQAIHLINLPGGDKSARFEHAGLLPDCSGHDITFLEFSPDGRRLAALNQSCGQLTLWDLATRSPLWSRVAHAEPDPPIAFSPDGTFLVTAGNEPEERSVTLRAWNLADGQPHGHIELAQHAFTQRLWFEGAAPTLVAAFSQAGPDSAVDFSDPDAPKLLPDRPVGAVSYAAIVSPDKRYAATFTPVHDPATVPGGRFPSHHIIVRDLLSNQVVLQSDPVFAIYWDARFLPDNTLVTATSDGVVRRWNIAAGAQTAAFTGNRIRPWDPRWTALLAAGSLWLLAWIASHARSTPRFKNARAMAGFATLSGLLVIALHWCQVDGPGGTSPLSMSTLVALAALGLGGIAIVVGCLRRDYAAIATSAIGTVITLLAAVTLWMRTVASM